MSISGISTQYELHPLFPLQILHLFSDCAFGVIIFLSPFHLVSVPRSADNSPQDTTAPSASSPHKDLELESILLSPCLGLGEHLVYCFVMDIRHIEAWGVKRRGLSHSGNQSSSWHRDPCRACWRWWWYSLVASPKIVCLISRDFEKRATGFNIPHNSSIALHNHLA